MTLRIYQSYFKEEQISLMDKEFYLLDNRENFQSELREHPLNLRCYQQSIKDNIDLWGLVSWKWRNKVHDISASQLIKSIESYPGYDIYFVNPYPNIDSIWYNTWEHGIHCHPYIIEICQELFPAIGLDPNLLFQPTAYDISCWGNYYVGNKKFWDAWLDLIGQYLLKLPTLSEQVQKMHRSSAQYPDDKLLGYFPFIHERLFSTFLVNYQHTFKIKSIPCGLNLLSPLDAHLRNIKFQALQTRDIPLLLEWDRLRGSPNNNITQKIQNLWK